MDQPDLPNRIFADGNEPAGDRVNHYFKLNTIRVILKALNPTDIERIRPFFGKLLDIYSKPVFSGKLAHFLLTRQLDVVRRHEIWCVFAGKPFRFSLREFGLVTGLNCNPLPPLDPSLLECPPGVTPYWFTLFGGAESCTGETLIAKLRRPKGLTDEMRLKYACLLLVDGFLCRRSFHMKIPKKHVEMIRDLDVFLNYPWGRYCFDMTMNCIKTRSRTQLAQATVAIQGFIHALVLVFVEAVPAVLSATGDDIDPESGEEEDFPVISLKLDKVWDLDGEDQVQVLSIIPSKQVVVGDCSWVDEVPDPRVDAMLQLVEEGTVFKRELFVGGEDGLALTDVPPSRAVKKGKRKVNVKLVEEYSEISKSKKSKGSSSRAKPAQADPNAKLLAAVRSQIRDGLKESQSMVYASISVELKGLESRIQQDIKKHVAESVTEYMQYKETLGTVLQGIGGQEPPIGGKNSHFGVSRSPPSPKAVQPAARTDEASLSKSTSQESVAVDAREAVGDLVPDVPPTVVHASCPGFIKLVQQVDPQKPIDFSGILLKGNDLLTIPTIIPPDHPHVMDACVSVIRDALVKDIDPARDPRADMLPCKFYGILAGVYSKFINTRRKDLFNFPPELVSFVSERFHETGKEWLKDVDYIYSPFNIDKNRWIGLVVNLRLHTLTVLDCTADVRRGSRLKPELDFICDMFPIFVRRVGANNLMKNFPIKPLTFSRNTHVTQATDRANTGILSLLFMEAHASGGLEHVRRVTETGIRLRAEQLAVEMYEHCYGDIGSD